MEKVYGNNNILFKILPCLLIAMYVIMCLFGSSVQAADQTITISTSFTDDFEVPAPPSDYYYAIITHKRNDSTYVCYIFTSLSKINFVSNDGTKFTFSSDSPIGSPSFSCGSSAALISYLKDYNYEDSRKFLTTASDSYKNQTIDLFFNSSGTLAKDIKMQSNCMKCEYNSDNELVFQEASLELAGVTIPAIQSSEEIPQAIIKTMKVVIPVGLVILGIGLVIYLTKSVILRMQ